MRTTRPWMCAVAVVAFAAAAHADPPPGLIAPQATTTVVPTAAAPSTTVAASTTAAPTAPPVAKKKFIVAAIGDSLTDARSGGGGYLAELRKKCPKSRFDNYGKGGQMVNQMRARFGTDVLGIGVPGKPAYTHVIVFGGVNDLYSDQTAGRTPEKIEGDLLRMYKAAKGKGMAVVAINVAPWGGFTKYFNTTRSEATKKVNKWIAAQVNAKNVDAVVDAYALLSCGTADKLCPKYATPYKDGLHFGPEGHKVLAKALSDKVFSNCE